MGKKTKPKGTKKAPKVVVLTKQQAKFCEHYARTGNGAESYFTAYPASRKHDSTYRAIRASELLKNSKVASHIEKLGIRVAALAEKKFDITAERVLQELAAVAFQNSSEIFEWGTYEREVWRKDKVTGEREQVFDKDGKPVIQHVGYSRIKPSAELSRQQKAAIVSVCETVSRTGERMIEAKMADKLGALKLLGTYNKLFNQQVDHTLTGKGGGPVQHELKAPDLKTLSPVDALKAFEAMRQTMAK